MSDAERIRSVWARAADDAKRSAVAPAFYRAIERLVPVAWEDGWFVVGLDAQADGALQGAIRSGENQLRIEAALRAASGEATLRLRLIEGITAADWASAKARDAAGAVEAQRIAQRRAVPTSANAANWDQVVDQVMKLWSEAEFRNVASGKGRFLQAALDLVERAMDNLGEVNEADERAFSRVIERIASSTGSDAGVLAYLLLERRRTKE